MLTKSVGPECSTLPESRNRRVLRQLEIQNSILNFFKPYKDVKKVRDGCIVYPGYTIFFGQGSFDDYCAWLGRWSDGLCAMAKDASYLQMLDNAAMWFPPDVLWKDILDVHKCCDGTIDKVVLQRIYNMSAEYRGAEASVRQVLLHLYYGMIADMNREGYQLGGMVKTMAAHRVLFEGIDAREAADESRMCSAGELREMCHARGIMENVTKNGR